MVSSQSSVNVRRETFALEIGRSIPTVYRALEKLEKEEWITRDWHACAGLRGSESLIIFTDSLCKLLGLPVEGKTEKVARALPPSSTSKPVETLPIANRTSSNEYQVLKEQPLQE